MFKNRQIFAKIWEQIDSPDILILNGPRQVGKTTLLQMIAQKLKDDRQTDDKQLIFFDLENIEHLRIWSDQISAKNSLPLDDTSTKYFVFIDEFQKSKTIGSTLKTLHDHHPNFKFIITGSASWYLDINESMAGRKSVLEIWPLNFAEYLDFQNKTQVKEHIRIIGKNPPAHLVSDPLIDSANAAFLDFVTFGGYPAVTLANSKEEKERKISELINSYLLRDIQLWNYAANSLQVKQLLTILSSQTGSLLDIASLSTNTGLGRSALLNRLELLQNTFVLFLSRPYFTNKIKELVKNPKIYLVDSGLCNGLRGNFSINPKTKEFGHLAENFVVAEMRKNLKPFDQINFWRTKQGQEVDVVLTREGQTTPIEIKSGDEKQIPPGLKAFIKQYKPKTAYVLNWSIIQDQTHEGCEVKFRPLWFASEIANNQSN